MSLVASWELPTIDLARCDGCGRCVEHCPTKAVELSGAAGAERRPVITRPADCAYCGLCEELCPREAIALAYEIHVAAPRARGGDEGRTS